MPGAKGLKLHRACTRVVSDLGTLASYFSLSAKKFLNSSIFWMVRRIRVYHFSGWVYAKFFYCQTPFILEIRKNNSFTGGFFPIQKK